jgi:integrase
MTISATKPAGKSGKSRRKAAPVTKQRFHIIHFTNPSSETVFRVAGYKPDGTRVRENWKTEEEAIARKAELDIEAANIKTATASRMKLTRLTEDELKLAEAAFLKVRGKPLLAVLDCGLEHYREDLRKATVQAAYDLFIADKEKQNKRPDTIRNLKGRVGMFKDLHTEKLVSDISQQTVSDFIFREGTSPRNQINDRLALSNFFTWAVKREYAASNPVEKVDRPEVDDNEPKILALEDCRKLLAAARAHKEGLLLPYVALGLFAGLRPAELSRLTWGKIDLADGTVTLDGSMAKTRQRRIVKLSDNAVAWLTPFALKKPAFTFSNFQRDFGRVKNAAGFNGKEGVKAKDGNPKPTRLIRRMLELTTAKDEGAIVCDFFGGSGTTAQAVLEANTQDGGNRKFVLVQLPEPTQRADFLTIAEITKERVRRVIKKLNDEHAGKLDLEHRMNPDRGFKVFKLQSSNFKPWNPDVPKDTAQLASQLEMHIDHIQAGRTQEDILYEILVKSGFPLATRAESLTLAGKTVFAIAEGMMLVCLEKELTQAVINEMAARKPERVVCLDEGFAGNDQLKTNAAQTMKAKGVTSFRTV